MHRSGGECFVPCSNWRLAARRRRARLIFDNCSASSGSIPMIVATLLLPHGGRPHHVRTPTTGVRVPVYLPQLASSWAGLRTRPQPVTDQHRAVFGGHVRCRGDAYAEASIELL